MITELVYLLPDQLSYHPPGKLYLCMLHTNPSASSWEDIKQTGGWSHGICGMCGIYDMAILRSPIAHLLRGAWCWWGEAYHHRIERYSWPQRLLNASWRGAPASARDKFYQFLVRITSQNDPNFEDPWLTSCGHANPRRHLGNWRSPISVDGEVRNFKNDWDLSSKGMKAHKKTFSGFKVIHLLLRELCNDH